MTPEEAPRLVLATTSPRRHKLLADAGFTFVVAAPDVDETRLIGERPDEMVIRLSEWKARAAAISYPGAHVLGFDTIVVVDERVLGKPDGAAGAIEMLAAISGRSHVVMTGYSLVAPDGSVEGGVVRSTVAMRDIPAHEAVEYVATGEPLDKAGAYALQGSGRRFVARIDGSSSNVIGLPVEAVIPMLLHRGFRAETGEQTDTIRAFSLPEAEPGDS